MTLRDDPGRHTGWGEHCRWGLGGPRLPGPQPDPGGAPMATTSTSAAVAVVELVFTESERLALAGFLAGYTSLTREAYALDLRQFASWCQLCRRRHNIALRRPRDYADLAAGAAGGGLMSGGKVGIIRPGDRHSPLQVSGRGGSIMGEDPSRARVTGPLEQYAPGFVGGAGPAGVYSATRRVARCC